MSEQEKKQHRIYDLLHTETKPKFLSNHIQNKETFLLKKKLLFFLGKGVVEDWTKNANKAF